LLHRALSEFHAKKATSDQIFEKYFHDMDMPKEEWERLVDVYHDASTLERLWVPKSGSEAQNAGDDAIRQDLLLRRLVEDIYGQEFNFPNEVSELTSDTSSVHAEQYSDSRSMARFHYERDRQVLHLWREYVCRQIEEGRIEIEDEDFLAYMQAYCRTL
jgi:hypothetical protein